MPHSGSSLLSVFFRLTHITESKTSGQVPGTPARLLLPCAFDCGQFYSVSNSGTAPDTAQPSMGLFMQLEVQCYLHPTRITISTESFLLTGSKPISPPAQVS